MRRFAKAIKRRVPGSMSTLEKAYDVHLKERLNRGEIERYDFEPEKFRLADKTFYTPDFRIVYPDLSIEFHEVKGSWAAPNQDKSRVKVKVAAEMHPYQFVAITRESKKNGGRWIREEF
jgi:hypothetical protein